MFHGASAVICTPGPWTTEVGLALGGAAGRTLPARGPHRGRLHKRSTSGRTPFKPGSRSKAIAGQSDRTKGHPCSYTALCVGRAGPRRRRCKRLLSARPRWASPRLRGALDPQLRSDRSKRPARHLLRLRGRKSGCDPRPRRGCRATGRRDRADRRDGRRAPRPGAGHIRRWPARGSVRQ
jgi:hypothetical protein